MLPFLKKSQEASAAPSEPVKRESDIPDEEYDSLHSAAQDLIDAVHSKDVAGVAEALQAAYDLCESQESDATH